MTVKLRRSDGDPLRKGESGISFRGERVAAGDQRLLKEHRKERLDCDGPCKVNHQGQSNDNCHRLERDQEREYGKMSKFFGRPARHQSASEEIRCRLPTREGHRCQWKGFAIRPRPAGFVEEEDAAGGHQSLEPDVVPKLHWPCRGLDNEAGEGTTGDGAEQNAGRVHSKALAAVVEEEDFDDDV